MRRGEAGLFVDMVEVGAVGRGGTGNQAMSILQSFIADHPETADWNSNSTRMPAANHNFYLRHCYLQNDLSNGRMVLSGKTLDLGRVATPMYVLSSREDHIAPARGVFKGAQCFGGPVRFVTAGSGHIAGRHDRRPDPRQP